MEERLKTLRKKLNLTQQEISDKLGVSRSTYAQYETGRVEPSAAVFALLCREFNVNEKWLRTGEGEMFVKKTEDEEREHFRVLIDRMLSDSDEKFRRALLEVILRMDARQVAAVKEYAVRYLLPAVEGEAAGAIEADDGEAFAEESAGSGPDPGAAPREVDISQGPAFDQASAETAADPGETLQKRSGLSEADEEEIRRKAQEYADMLREEKRAEGRSSSLNDGRLKKEA